MTTQLIALYLYPDVEVLDFAGPFEVFTTAARVLARTQAGAPPRFQVVSVGRTREAVRARAGLVFTPDQAITDAFQPDVLLIPGGVVTAELEKADVSDWIARASAGAKLTASICTGAFLLAKAGLLDGLRATTHWEDVDDLRSQFPRLTVVPDRRWVDEGRIVTSGGISAGIDMSLHLVERLAGRDLAQKTARQMEWVWTEA